MEEIISAGVNSKSAEDSQKRNRIYVSNTKQPVFFYVDLAKKYLQEFDEVEFSAVGMAASTLVTVAEILKHKGLAVEKRIETSTADFQVYSRPEPVQKARIEIVLGKSENFDEMLAVEEEARARRSKKTEEGEEQS